MAVIEASSSRAASVRAFDGIAETAWCPTFGDKRGELELRFPTPVTLKSVAVYAGRIDLRHATDGWYRPAPIEVRAGEAVIRVDPRERGQGPILVDAAKGRSLEKLTFRLPPTNPRDQRCLAEVDVELEEGPWFFGIPASAAAELSAAIENLTAALRACDPQVLKKMSHFPVRRRELQVGFAGAEKHLVLGGLRNYRDVAALARDCRDLVFPGEENAAREPIALQSLGPGIVRVLGNRGGGVVYWRLGWEGSRWRLTGIDFTSFE